MSDSRAGVPVDAAPYTIAMPLAPVTWAEMFGNDHPVEVEVGSGNGLFLVNSARENPERNYLGIEMAKKYAHKAAKALARAELVNARMLPGDARKLLHDFVPRGSLAALHIYFPDPWWKKRHRKRRVFCEGFVVDAANALPPGGLFHIATDVEEYFGVMMELMAAHPEFVELPRPEPKAPEHDFDYLTNFERKYRIEGRAIYRAKYQRS
jgi:tRNA (guanine-N7-)-methyltransferase